MTFTEQTKDLPHSELDRQARRNAGLGRRPGQEISVAADEPKIGLLKRFASSDCPPVIGDRTIAR